MNQLEEPARSPSASDRGNDPVSVEPAEEEISLLDLLIVIVERRRLIGKVVLWTTLAGVILACVLPVRYTASTSILPPQQGSSAGAALMAQMGSLGSIASLAGGGLGLKNPSDLQVALLRSRTVEDAMLDRFHLVKLYRMKRRSDARKKLEKAIDIEDGLKDGLIRISATDSDPQRAADMANGYVEEFKKFSSTLAVTEASRRRLFFEQQLGQAKDNLAKAEENLKITEQKTGLIQLDAQARSAIALVADLRAQIAAKEVEINAMRSYETGENPQLQIAEQQLAGLQSQEAKMGAASENSENVFLPKGNLQESSIEYIQKVRDVKYYETVFDLMARQYEIAKVDEARQGAMVQVVDQAIVPDRRSSPLRTLIVLGFAVFGLLLGVAWAFTAESLLRISKNPEERARLEALKGSIALGRKRSKQA